MDAQSTLASELAVLLIATGGVCVVLRLQIAWKLLLAGAVSAAGAYVIPNRGSGTAIDRIDELAAWIGLIALCAALLGPRKRRGYFSAIAVACWTAVPLILNVLDPVIHGLAQYWWILGLLILAPAIAAVIANAALDNIRFRTFQVRPSTALRRFFARLLNRTLDRRAGRGRSERYVGGANSSAHGRRGRRPS